mmetsp:Transcript_69356/g.154691  ORF Transcript_69356/g.154691 Transcript_69356/m.154691 type:complete len:211 (+) Transcript_69356:937-1569(+)
MDEAETHRREATLAEVAALDTQHTRSLLHAEAMHYHLAARDYRPWQLDGPHSRVKLPAYPRRRHVRRVDQHHATSQFRIARMHLNAVGRRLSRLHHRCRALLVFDLQDAHRLPRTTRVGADEQHPAGAAVSRIWRRGGGGAARLEARGGDAPHCRARELAGRSDGALQHSTGDDQAVKGCELLRGGEGPRVVLLEEGLAARRQVAAVNGE